MKDQILNFQSIIISDCDERKEYKKSRSQGSYYFQNRVLFQEGKGRIGGQQSEVGRLLGEAYGD